MKKRVHPVFVVCGAAIFVGMLFRIATLQLDHVVAHCAMLMAILTALRVDNHITKEE